jgi:hypothetical protein
MAWLKQDAVLTSCCDVGLQFASSHAWICERREPRVARPNTQPDGIVERFTHSHPIAPGVEYVLGLISLSTSSSILSHFNFPFVEREFLLLTTLHLLIAQQQANNGSWSTRWRDG